jgi:VCBS repeat-containing protein
MNASKDVTATFTTGATNHPPVATDDSADAANDGPAVQIDVLANDTDADATDVLSVQSVDLTGTAGSVVNNGTDVDYTPAAGFTGADTFTYTVSDGHGGTDTATVTVTVKGNAPPVATDDTANANEHGPAVHVDVLANDTDPDSDVLTVTSVDTTGTAGTVTNNGTEVTYDPNGAFNGLATGQTDTGAFTYIVSDGHGGTDTATVTVTIHGQNDAPSLAVVADQTIPEMVLFNTLALSGSDPDGDSLTYSVQSGPSGLTVNAASGVVSWTPTEAQGPGDYPVTVRVADASLHADRSFTIHVTEVNRPPSLAAIADQTVNPGDVVG